MSKLVCIFGVWVDDRNRGNVRVTIDVPEHVTSEQVLGQFQTQPGQEPPIVSIIQPGCRSRVFMRMIYSEVVTRG